MLKTLVGMQGGLRELQNTQEPLLEEEKKKRATQILIQISWIRVLQTIADGIAWRAYGFNRPLMRLMSENDSYGRIDQIDYDYVKVLEKNLIYSHLTIPHDLTRVLRIGDLSRIYRDGRIVLIELKQKGEKVIDARTILKEIKLHKVWPSSQKNRHLVAQFAIINNQIRVPRIEEGRLVDEVNVEIIDLDFRIKNHFSMCKKLFRIAERKGIASIEAEEGYFIKVINQEKIIDSESADRIANETKKRRPKWTQNNDGTVLMLSNYDSFIQKGGEFPRNIVPFCLFPFKATDCVKLMMGHFDLTIYLDINILRKKIEGRGWRVENGPAYMEICSREEKESSKKEFQKGKRGQMFNSRKDDRLFLISREDDRGTYSSSVLFTELLIMAFSLYSFDFLLDGIEACFRNRKALVAGIEARTITKNYLGEKKVLR